MIDRNNPAIDVDDLMARIQREVARRRLGPDSDISFGTPNGGLDTAAIESLLSTARQRAEPRSRTPDRLNVFPWNRLGWLQRFALRLFGLLFKDQRQVNFALIDAVRDLVQVNSALHDRVTALEESVERLEDGNARREADG